MEKGANKITMEQLCTIIDIFDPCMDDYLYAYDLKNDYYAISPSALQRFNVPAHKFHDVTKTHEQFVHPDDLEMLVDDLAQIERGEKSFHNLQYRWLDREKQPIWINCRGRSLKDEMGEPYIMLGCINEIGAKQKADNISGLLGETSFKNHLDQYKEHFPNGYMLRIGIDNFKEINENWDMEYGDMILRETAHRIAECIEPGQMLYKLVADEFMIMDFAGGTKEHAREIYRKVRKNVDRFIEKNQYEVVYTMSAGLVMTDDFEKENFSDVMKLTEFALNEAKRRGKRRLYTYVQQDYDEYMKKKELIRILRRSVYNNFEGFDTYFQPIVEGDNGKLRSAETLLRFSSPETGPIPPIKFIPLLEETGLIIPVGRWALRQALGRCREIQKYSPDFKVGVNLSYIQIAKSHVLSEILAALDEFELTPSDVIIELTESGFLESNSNFISFWDKLKKEGVEIAIDDFGTGYSNFHYLYELNPNMIKIDRSFTVRALKNDYEYKLLNYIVEMAHSLNLKLCVEGIETLEELGKIRELGPDYIQGFYFGKPCPYDEFLKTYVNG